MSKNKVYISCPLTVDMKDIKGVEKVLTDLGFAVNYWDRSLPSNKYSDGPVRYCDIFVIILPERKWAITRSLLPAGTYKELKLAIECGKPIYLGYFGVMSEKYAVYHTTYDNDKISGVAGSYNHIRAFAPKLYEPSLVYPTSFRAMPDDIDHVKEIFDPVFPTEQLQSRMNELTDFDPRILLFFNL